MTILALNLRIFWTISLQSSLLIYIIARTIMTRILYTCTHLRAFRVNLIRIIQRYTIRRTHTTLLIFSFINDCVHSNPILTCICIQVFRIIRSSMPHNRNTNCTFFRDMEIGTHTTKQAQELTAISRQCIQMKECISPLLTHISVRIHWQTFKRITVSIVIRLVIHIAYTKVHIKIDQTTVVIKVSTKIRSRSW